MSKFIKIPSYQNPCEIIINGVKYQYPAGQTCLVPDDVAMVIENVINNAPKYVKETVRRPDIVETVSGEVISVSDSTEAPLQGLRVFGKTIQNGTPTPDNPVALESVGTGGYITVNIGESQTISVSTPTGLPGIPVSSGGNYTDANGQQWICDYVDFEKGLYVQRIKNVILDGSSDETWTISNCQDTTKHRHMILIAAVVPPKNVSAQPIVMCSHYVAKTAGDTWLENEVCALQDWSSPNVAFMIYDHKFSTLDSSAWKNYLAENPITCMMALAEPIERSITTEELAAYASMHTNYPDTTAYNDAGAFMEVQYVADTKRYVDNKFNVLAAMVNNA